MNAYFMEWAVLNPKAANQTFNPKDGSHFTYGRLWPMLARWYGTTYEGPVLDESKYSVHEVSVDVPPRG